MKRVALAPVLVVVLAAGCGQQGASRPQDVVPERPLIVVMANDPATILTRVDGYIAAGVADAGEHVASTALLEKLPADSLEALGSSYGLDPNGAVVAFLQSFMPNSFGVAATAADPEAFWRRLEELGVSLGKRSPVGDVEVRTVQAGGLSLELATHRGLLLVGGNLVILRQMIERLEGDSPSGQVPDLAPASVHYGIDLGSLAPMVLPQLQTMRSTMVSQMRADGVDETELIDTFLDLYLGAVQVLFEGAGMCGTSVTLETDQVELAGTLDLIEGSRLAELLQPAAATDLARRLPAGAIASIQASLPPPLLEAILRALYDALELPLAEPDLELMVELFCQSATVVSHDPGTPLHMAGVYRHEGGATLDQLTGMLQEQYAAMSEVLPGFEVSDQSEMEINGQRYVSFTTEMHPEALGQPEIAAPGALRFVNWLTVADDGLFFEAAAEPSIVPRVLDRSWQGSSAWDVLSRGGDPSHELEGAVDMVAYMRAVLEFGGAELPFDPAALGAEPVWVHFGLDLQDQRAVSSCSLSGPELARFVERLVDRVSQQ